MSQQTTSLDDLVVAMTSAVQSDGRLRKKFNAVVCFDIKDANHQFGLNISEQENADMEHPDLTVMTELPVLQELLAKKLTPQQAFLKGKIKVQGKMALAMKLQMVLDSTRKHLARQTSRL